jgi:hypothetical protein
MSACFAQASGNSLACFEPVNFSPILIGVNVDARNGSGCVTDHQKDKTTPETEPPCRLLASYFSLAGRVALPRDDATSSSPSLFGHGPDFERVRPTVERGHEWYLLLRTPPKLAEFFQRTPLVQIVSSHSWTRTFSTSSLPASAHG